MLLTSCDSIQTSYVMEVEPILAPVFSWLAAVWQGSVNIDYPVKPLQWLSKYSLGMVNTHG